MGGRFFRPTVPQHLRKAKTSLLNGRDALNRANIDLYQISEQILVDAITSAEFFIAEAKKQLLEKPIET